MSTTKNKQAITVGFFITIGLVILIVGIFTLGGQKKTFSPSLSITAVFNNVNGLQKGNNVWFSGVKIGTVKSLDFYGTSQVKVTLYIDRKAHEFIRKDARAKISAEGLIGNKIVVIYGGTQQAGAIEGGENLQVDEALNPDELLATLQTNNKNLADITADFKVVSKRLVEGQGSLGALLRDDTLYRNLQITITSLRATVANLQTAARHSEQFTGSMADYTARLKTPGTLAGDLVTDTVIMTNLRTAMEQINLATASTAAFMHTLDNAGEKLEESDNAAGLLLNDEKTARDLRSTLQYLNSSSQRLDENLEALQHSFLFRGYFRRKAKREAREAKDSVRKITSAQH
ncbi:MCE family protein [Pseudoflavitalea sp. X16]|uniref:MlaD family protein n=1 Tax=Paraflavitalea devenefica TaxID=2716334 RepID=UPI001420FCC4|nr:MlaD family protein [Paraflavitalea devenefica]NII27667.1 MCE family protein [Paraflavitalea devenefica]